MKDEDKTKEQLINELVELRQRVAELEAADTGRLSAEQAGKRAQKDPFVHDSEDQPVVQPTMYQSPVLLVTIIALLIFVSEVFVMIIIPFLPPFPTSFEVLLDSAFLVILLSPMLYFFLFRPLVLHITERERAEKTLRESEEIFRSISTSAQDAVIMIDSEENISFWNEAAEGMFDYSSPEALGKELHMLLAPERYYEAYREGFGKFKTTGRGAAVGKTLELEAVRKDGTEFPIALSLSAVKLRGKWNAIGIVRDITERKQAEEALRESEEKYRTILETIEDSYFEVSTAGNFTFFNDSLCRLLGYSEDELMGMNNREYMDDENARKVYQTFNAVYRTGESARAFDWEIIRKDGTRRFVEASVSLMRDPTGKPIGFRGVVRDITERKRAEKALRESEERLRGLFETMAEGIVVIAPDGQIVRANPAAERILGLKRAEIETRKYVAPEWEILRPDGTPMPPEEMAGPQAMKEKRLVKDVVMGTKRPDGSISWINVSAAPLINEAGELEGVVGTFADITERMRAEEALRESEERYRTLVENQGEGIGFVDTEEHFTFANPAAHEIFGVPPDGLIGRSLREFVDEETFALVQAQTEVRQAGKESIYELEINRPDGERRSMLVTATSRFDHEGQFVGTFGIFRDITERKRAEREIEERRMYLEVVLGAAPDAIVTLDAHHRIVEWNAGAAKLFGYSQEEVIGRNLDDLVTNPDVYEEATGFTQRALGGKEVPPTEGVRYRKDGSPVDVLLAGSPILVGDELIGVVAVYTDITARVRMEETLRALALLDELTNLYNRRGFSVLAEQQLKMAERGKRKMLLLFADLDGLKWINDTFGHSEGDRALMETADVLEETFRESDIVARIGGDEFVVLAVETNGSPAEVLVHRLQENLEARNARRDRRYELSLSVGLARYDPERPCSIEELLTQADRAMYERKQG